MEATTPPSSSVPAPARDATLDSIASFFDAFSRVEERWRKRNSTYHRLIERIHRFLIPPGTRVLELGSGSGDLLAALEPSRGVGVDVSAGMTALASERHPDYEFVNAAAEEFVCDETFDYVVLSDLAPFAYDIQAILANVARMTHPRSRIVIHSYSQLWRPVIRMAELLRLKEEKPIQNWVTSGDVSTLLDLAGFEVISVSRRIIFPKQIPLLTTFLNGVVANLWPFTYLALTYWVVARPKPRRLEPPLSVSVVIPCRNEQGMIAEIVDRIPDMGAATEIIFVEGGSRDDTYAEVERQIARRADRTISLHRQTGKGKADAVRLGFEHARHDVLMILDADLTVMPEELPKFYDALASGHAEFVNGSRLVYGLAPGSMQFLNILGNKVFSRIFTFLIGQPVKDTLCGTKVLRREDYKAIARNRAEFGDLDPFGDFDLLLGAAQLSLRITDLPIRYQARSYGATNIARFSHGWLLLRMAVTGFRRLKAQPVTR
ncbi:MAG TPA: glycosyltransferase [Gaiellaceae bacterium]|nr:glycosyltransferase [Gaiellaceae bacterium]